MAQSREWERIMKNVKINFSKVCYLIVGISVILIIAIFSNYFDNVKESAWEVKRGIQQGNARFVSGYIEDLFKSRITSLELLADVISDVDISNNEIVSEKIATERALFDNISLVDTEGTLIYGRCNTDKITDDIGFKSAVGGQSAISDNMAIGNNANKELRVFSPVRDKDDNIHFVLVASFLSSTLSDYIEHIDSGEDKCIAVMNSKGRIMYGSSNMEDVYGRGGVSYLAYLKNCGITSPGIGIDDIQYSIRKQEEIFFEYRHDRKSYIATAIPIEFSDGYIIYMSESDSAKSDDEILSSNALNLIRVLAADIFVIFLVLIYFIVNRLITIKLLNNYNILDKLENAIVFDYLIYPKKRIEVHGDFESLFGREFKTLVGEAVYDVYDVVHEDDASIRGRLHKFFDNPDDKFSSEIRVADPEGNYRWYRITGTMINEKKGKVQRFVGRIVNADNQISTEKNLTQRAENDLLTGVLNKKTVESKIAEVIKNDVENRYYIFYMVDLDNFKSVNDTLGHIYGDTAISDTAKFLSEIFHSNSLVGRLGGDEFVVCLWYDAFDEVSLREYVIKKAEKICEVNRRSYTDGASTVKISSSVGISIAPMHGTDFEALYRRADEALYNSKKTGKNKYTIYSQQQ